MAVMVWVRSTAFLLALDLLDCVYAVDPENMWKQRDGDGNYIEKLGDPSPGLKQRTCYSYHGHFADRQGKEWAQSKCTAPFDQVCDRAYGGHAPPRSFGIAAE